MRRGSSEWLRRVYPHNPLYLVSVVLVLWGIHVASADAPGSSWVKTQLLMAYIVMLAASGWLVVRFGGAWEDARTILLAVLLMFTALSTSYDLLCLNDANAGGRQLAVAFAFSCATVEVVLRALGLRLPLAYRIPFWIQLAVLFAFPAYLGQLSIDGQDADMCLGVMAYSLAAGASLLTLIPAIRARSLVAGDNGTPWSWPGYPWSIFVFMSIAMAVRSWMLSVSFSHAKGLDAAFGWYFLTPIVIAAAMLLLELGLAHSRRTAQGAAIGLLCLAFGLAFPGADLSRAQDVSLGLLELDLAGPPLLAAISITLIAAYGAARRAALAAPVAVMGVVSMTCLDPDTRTVHDLHLPHTWSLCIAALWLGARGVWRLDGPMLAGATGLLAFLTVFRFEVPWLELGGGFPAAAAWAVAALSLPLYCRDLVSRYLLETGPGLLAVAGPVVLFAPPPAAWHWLPAWVSPLAVALLGAFCVFYALRLRVRWPYVPAVWLAVLAALSGAAIAVGDLNDVNLRRGLMLYGAGCVALVAALLVSLAKSGQLRTVGRWLANSPPNERPRHRSADSA